MKIRLKNIPEGYEIRNKKLVKTMATGGSVTKSTLQPVSREDANVEAEKNETVLTDMDQDGFFELYNVGGKRHSGGGTPLNLPEQSFIYSDTRKMKFTKDELKQLGVNAKKRLTPAAVSKKFPINKYMDVLKDESSDEISITTAEAMIKKNKIKLSHIAFLQEKKKNFEDGLPLAAYPFLLENGVDPKEFEAKLEQKKQEGQQPMHQMPDGTMMPGATHGEAPQQGGQQQPSPEMMQQMMAMQQQGQGMPPQGPPMQGPPQGMMPPMGMAMGGMELKNFVYGTGGGIDNPGFNALPPEAQQNIINNMQNGGEGFDWKNVGKFAMKAINPLLRGAASTALAVPGMMLGANTAYANGPTDEQLGQTRVNVPMPNGNTREEIYMGSIDPFSQEEMDVTNQQLETAMAPKFDFQMGGQPSIIPADMVEQYNAWRTQNRLKDIPEIQMMFLNTMNNEAPIMPGHSTNFKPIGPISDELKEMRSGTLPGWKETLKGFIPDNYDYVVDDPMQGIQDFKNHMVNNINPFKKGGEFKPHMMFDPETGKGYKANKPADHEKYKKLGYLHKDEMQMGGQPSMGVPMQGESQMSQQEMQMMGYQQALQDLNMKKQQMVMQFQSNPELSNDPKAQQYFENLYQQIEYQIYEIQTQMQLSKEKEMMNKTTIPLSDFIGETVSPSNQTNNYEYFNPDRLMRRGGSIGRSIPRFDEGGEDDDIPVATTFDYQGTDENGYPISLNPYYRTSPTAQYLDGVENPNYDVDFEQSVDKGVGSHEQFFNIMVSPNFKTVRDEWIQQYKDLDVAGKIDTDDEQKLFKAFNDMNILLNSAFSSGQEFKDKTNISKQLETIAKKMGMEVPTTETIKMYQGMYNSLAAAKLTGSDDTKALLEQVNVNFGDKAGGAYEIVDGSGQYVSDIDGLIGDTTSKQFVSVNDDVDIVTTKTEFECDEETKKLMIQKCMEEGKSFNPKTCDCHEKPQDTPVGKIPPYLTFPGDDLKVGALASIKRDKKYGILQNYDPIQRDPGYVDDRAGVAAATALANQAMQLGNVSDVQGRTQDQIDKIQANRWATNTKIFDNTQAYNVGEINKARELNSGYMQNYQDMVNKVDQEYDNTKIADMMNLVDAETTRMDNADKLQELNLRNPNYYFDPQKHSTIFQNPAALEAYRGNPNAQPVTMAEAINECRNKMGIVDEAQLIKCAELRMKSTNNPQAVDYTRGDVSVNNDNNNNDDTQEGKYGGSYRYGGTIRERDLRNSSNNLRKWIMGIE